MGIRSTTNCKRSAFSIIFVQSRDGPEVPPPPKSEIDGGRILNLKTGRNRPERSLRLDDEHQFIILEQCFHQRKHLRPGSSLLWERIAHSLCPNSARQIKKRPHRMAQNDTREERAVRQQLSACRIFTGVWRVGKSEWVRIRNPMLYPPEPRATPLLRPRWTQQFQGCLIISLRPQYRTALAPAANRAPGPWYLARSARAAPWTLGRPENSSANRLQPEFPRAVLDLVRPACS